MIYIILLLILAALLFGSSAVIGFLGLFLGFIVAAIAVLWASIAFGLEPWVILLGGAGVLIALIPIGTYCDSKLRKDREKLDRMKADLSPEARKIFEETERKAREQIAMKKLPH